MFTAFISPSITTSCWIIATTFNFGSHGHHKSVTHKMTAYNIFQTTAWIWNSYNKIIRFQEHRCFYRNCIRHKVTPAGLGYNITLGFRQSGQQKINLHNIREDAERKVLRESLKILQYKIDSEYRPLNQKQNTLSHLERRHVWDIMSRGKK